ncbi:MAG: LacI family transcriptional regulator [Bifidobacteriaceae bacterium]|jgi:LacI family transcriptional regulator|nr:LacI family transcriptional regulator [Bifidobacteriaceae bacterium]
MATIVDVAAAARVSTATVTRYLHTPQIVRQQTGERIRQAIDELGYRPNLVARGLRQRSSRLIGLVIQDVENMHFTAICRGAEDVMRDAGYCAVLCDTDDDVTREGEYLQMLAAQTAAGVILNPASAQGTDITPVSLSGIPVVSIEMDLDAADDSVHCDNVEGARLATAHLAEMGGARIACVTGESDVPSAQERMIGYCQALGELGRRVDPSLIAHTNYREDEAEAAVSRMLSRPNPPDAIFLAGNRLATGAMRALNKAHVKAPDDVLLAAFDEVPWSDLLATPVTTIGQPAYEIGQMAAKLLLERINGFNGPARRIVLPPNLTPRASSARRGASSS